MKIKEEYNQRAIKILNKYVDGTKDYGFDTTTEIMDLAINKGLKEIENDLGI